MSEGVRAPGRGELLAPDVVARLGGLHLRAQRRVTGRYAGGHRSRRHGSSLEFADFREYVAGDDPRRVDLAAYRRLGRLLVKVMEAEDEAPVRIVLDQSASKRFGAKLRVAQQLAAAITVLAAAGQDPVRVLLAGTAADPAAVDPGPWARGRGALAQVTARLLAAGAAFDALAEDDEPPAPADPAAALVAALHRANGEGSRGPVLLASDLLFVGFDEVLRALAGRGGDAVLLHVVGRDDLEPDARGDLRLVDAETGAEVEVASDVRGLRAHAEARDAWLAEVDAIAGRHGIVVVRVVDDERIEDVVLEGLRSRGVVA